MINREFKSYPKVNLFLKIVGVQGNYHQLFFLFLRVHSIYDTLSFQNDNLGKFVIHGDFDFPLETNIIYQTYISLLNYLDKSRKQQVIELFQQYSLKVDKQIPMMAGLGGGSSNSATFLNMVDEVANLKLELNEKIEIVKKLGSDIIFFLYDIESANVFGTGDIIEKLDEPKLNIETFTPPIQCHTGKVYSMFRDNFFHTSSIQELHHWKTTSSLDLFQILDIEYGNDLYQPAKRLCPNLESWYKDGYLFSGSGSSFFTIRN